MENGNDRVGSITDWIYLQSILQMKNLSIEVEAYSEVKLLNAK